MFRLEYAVSGYVHHTVAHRSSAEHSKGGHYDGCTELRRLCTYCRVKEIDSIIAHTDPKVRNGKCKEKNYKT